MVHSEPLAQSGQSSWLLTNVSRVQILQGSSCACSLIGKALPLQGKDSEFESQLVHYMVTFKVKLFKDEKQISETVVDTGLTNFPGPKGTTTTGLGGFKVVWSMQETKENKKAVDEFLEQYPTPESYHA